MRPTLSGAATVAMVLLVSAFLVAQRLGLSDTVTWVAFGVIVGVSAGAALVRAVKGEPVFLHGRLQMKKELADKLKPDPDANRR